jgi:hypothetical protein
MRLRVATKTGGGAHYAVTKATAWIGAAKTALELYGDDPAVPFRDLADELATDVALPRVIGAEMARHAVVREEAYRQVDPDQLARSLPGVGLLGGRALVEPWDEPHTIPLGQLLPSLQRRQKRPRPATQTLRVSRCPRPERAGYATSS